MTKKIHRDGDEWQHHLKAILSKIQYNALVGELGCSGHQRERSGAFGDQECQT